ncbi:MAG: hypothetical protein LW807_05820 [Proteobacteria bacterium]|jgi:hypothetical protein|nr:hypothetical protein [Pseudomonadota bacterium]
MVSKSVLIEKNLYLHILTGVQAGSSIQFQGNTRYTISSNFGADIYIKFENNLNFEASFDIIDDKIVFIAATSDIELNGGLLILGEEYLLPLYFSLMGINLLFSLDGEPAPDPAIDISSVIVQEDDVYPEETSSDEEGFSLDVTNTQDHEDVTTEELAEMGISPIDDGQTIQDSADSSENVGFTFKEGSFLARLNPFLKSIKNTYSNTKSIVVLQYNKLKQKIGYWAYVVLGVAALFVIGLFILSMQVVDSNTASKVQNTQGEVKTQIQQKFLQLPRKYSSLKFNMVNGEYVIQGMVAENKDIKELQEYFKQWNSILKFKVSSFVQIKPQLVKLLEQSQILHLGVVFNPDAGSINVMGVISSMERLEDAEISVSTKLPEVGYVDTNKVFLLSDINNDLVKMFDNSKYAQRLGVEKNLNTGVVSVSGYLSSKDSDAVAKEVETFNSKYLGVVSIKLDIKDISKALPFSITEVHTGNPAWIVTDDGIRTFVGGDYKGFNLYLVDDDKIILKGKFTLAIRLNDLISHPWTNKGSINNSQTDISSPRQNILDSEMEKEKNAIKENESLLQHLQYIESKTTDIKLKTSLKKIMSGVVEDLSTKKQEYHYYWKDKKES